MLSAITIQSYAAARQPLQTLLSFGLSLIVSLPMSSRAGNMRMGRDQAPNERHGGVVAAAAQKTIS